MDEKVLTDKLIEEYFNLQRIKNAVDREVEIEYQEKVLLKRMYCMGFSLENIEDICV